MTAAQIILDSTAKASRKSFQENQWGKRHAAAMVAPTGFEVPIVSLIRALASYADAHLERYESPVGNDGVLGKEWLAIMQATRGLLNGELGRLDGGTLDGLLFELARHVGFDDKELE